MTTNFKRLGALLLAAAMLGGACADGGGEKEAAENPDAAFTDALEAFGEYEGATFVMSIEADADDLVTPETPKAVAEALVNSSMTVSGRSGETPEDGQVEITVDVDGNEDAVQMKALGTSLYLRAEVRELVEAFGGDAAAVDAAVQQGASVGFDFAEPLADGEWVGVEGLDELAKQFGAPVATPDPEQAAEFADRIVEILSENATVKSEGTDDTGAHLVVSVPLKDTLGEVTEALKGFGGGLGQAVPAPGLEDVPDADIPIDVWISDGELVQVEVDVVAVAEELGEEPPEGVDELAFRVTIEEFTDEVEAPSDFVEIDLQQVLQGFFGATPGMIEETPAG